MAAVLGVDQLQPGNVDGIVARFENREGVVWRAVGERDVHGQSEDAAQGQEKMKDFVRCGNDFERAVSATRRQKAQVRKVYRE